MNIYLDVDGVILEKSGKPANYIKNFLDYLSKNHSVYWLTTHCNGDATTVTNYLKEYLPEDVLRLTLGFKATEFRTWKTEAIDFSKDFRWFDDYAMKAEIDILKTNESFQKLILVDLKENPNFFEKQEAFV